MPLHAEHIARPAPANRFDDAVGHTQRLDHQIAPKVFHGLVVNRVDLGHRDAGVHLRQPRALDQIHVVQRALVQVAVAVRNRVRDLGRNVLEQRAAECHVDQLATPANAEHRFACGHKGVEQVDLVAVANAVAGPLGGQRSLTVTLGRDIGAALQHQAVEVLGVRRETHVGALDQALTFDRRDHHREHVLGHHPVRDRLFEVVQGLGVDAAQVKHRADRVVNARRDANDQRPCCAPAGLQIAERRVAARKFVTWRATGRSHWGEGHVNTPA